MNQPASKYPDSSDDGLSLFAELANELSKMAGKEGLSIVPYYDPKLIHFAKLPPEFQSHVLWVLGMMVKLSQDIQKSGHKMRSPAALIWSFFKQMGYTPSSDLHSKIGAEDSVDIYNSQHKLIFANLRFFELVSYSLEDLYCRPWMELFTRDDETITGRLLGICQEIVEGKHSGGLDMRDVGAHIIRESRSGGYARIQPQFFSPLVMRGQVDGYVCINRILRIDWD